MFNYFIRYRMKNIIRNYRVKAKEKLKSYIIPFGLVIFIMIVFFGIPSKNADIKVEGKLKNANIKEFSGDLIGYTSQITKPEGSDNSKFKLNITNLDPITITLNEKTYKIKPYMLEIRYGEVDFRWGNLFKVSSPMQLSMDFDKYDLNYNKFLVDHILDGYTLNLESVMPEFYGFMKDKEYSLEIRGNVQIYIDGKIYKTVLPLYCIDIKSDYDVSSYRFTDASEAMIFLDDKTTFLEGGGKCKNINLSFESGEMEFDQEVYSNTYKLENSEVKVESDKDTLLNVRFLDKSQWKFWGESSNVILDENNIGFKFKNWIYENYSELIMTVIALFLGIIITKKD